MFGFLKEKLSKTIKSITEKVEKEPEVKKEVKKGGVKKVFEKVTKKVLEKEISEKDFSEVLDNLGISLIEADVAFEVSEKIKEDLKKNLIGKRVKRGRVKESVINAFRDSLLDILNIPKVDLEETIKNKKPCLFVFLGFNGSGKTTSLAKVGNYLKGKGYSCVFAAGDSFRAASIEQLEEHGRKLKIDVIKHRYGADSAAVIFDAKKHAESKNLDVVLADTAGRSHMNKNLMDELNKVGRVNKPDLKILVIDSLVGNDAVPQAKMFNGAIGVDAVIFTKIDVNEKGGAILSVANTLKKPILFLGIGQEYSSLKTFNPEKFIDKIL